MKGLENVPLLAISKNKRKNGFLYSIKFRHFVLAITTAAAIAAIVLYGIKTNEHFASLQLAENAEVYVVINSALGKLRGNRTLSRQGRTFYAFYGVPYAQPPVNELRFSAPKRVQPWNGIFDATTFGPKCIQRYPHSREILGDEACLNLNIFTPSLGGNNVKARFPVIVYFYGGAFLFGDANDFKADYFMDEDVLLVIPQYRVRALGFLNSGDGLIGGNMGLKDQVEAMKWVKTYISAFGGDPSRIVPMGTSAGAMAAHGHLLSPMANGLISRAISLSGTALAPYSMLFSPPEKTAIMLAEEVGCISDSDSTNMSKIVSCLRSTAVEKIVLSDLEFGVTVDSGSEEMEKFLPDLPINLVKSGKQNNVPWLVGVTSAESIYDSYKLLLNEQDTEELNTNFSHKMKEVLIMDSWDNQNELEDIMKRMKEFYFMNDEISKDKSTRFNLTNLIGDRFHYHPTKTSALFHAMKNDVYLYYLTKEANVSYAGSVEKYVDPPYGVSHADDVQYILSRPGYPYIPVDSPWFNFSKMFVKALVTFAQNGVPSIEAIGKRIQWDKVDPDENGRVWFELGDHPGEIRPITKRLEFFDSLPFELLYRSSTSNADE